MKNLFIPNAKIHLSLEQKEIMTSCTFFFIHTFLSQLPSKIQKKIIYVAQESSIKNMIFVQNMFQDTTKFTIYRKRMSCAWEFGYENQNICLVRDTLCQNVPLQYYNCKCRLFFSIYRVCIDMRHCDAPTNINLDPWSGRLPSSHQDLITSSTF